MTLLKCPECGKKFIDTDQACPNCGCPAKECSVFMDNNQDKKSLIESVCYREKLLLLLLSLTLSHLLLYVRLWLS